MSRNPGIQNEERPTSQDLVQDRHPTIHMLLKAVIYMEVRHRYVDFEYTRMATRSKDAVGLVCNHQ